MMELTLRLALASFCAVVVAIDTSNSSDARMFQQQYQEFVDGWDSLSASIVDMTGATAAKSNALAFLPCTEHTWVTMSDGTNLSTRIVKPWPCHRQRGTILVRSMYWQTSSNIAIVNILLNGFAAVQQELRGTFASKGNWSLWQRDGQDGRETMNWIVRQPWSNGDIYTSGASADGVAAMTPWFTGKTPMVKGQWNLLTVANAHELAFEHGSFKYDLTHAFMKTWEFFTHRRADLVYDEMLNHEAFGPWWYNMTDCADESQPEVPPGCHYANVEWPVVTNTGFWDPFFYTSLRYWFGIAAKSDTRVRDQHVLIVDPIGHGFLGPFAPEMKWKFKYREAMAFGAAVGAEVAVEKFAGHVHGPVRSKIGRVNLFVMGDYGGDASDVGNYWTSLDAFPNFTSRTFHLEEGGFLSAAAPKQRSSIDYIYDPRNESGLTPWNGGNVFHLGHVKNVASADQLFRDVREDVLVFDSDPLADDLAIVGRVRAKLFVSSSANDTDFCVTVTDLAPGKKRSMLVRYGNFRMRWRNSELEQAPSMTPGDVYEIDVDLLHTAYIFPKGNSVRVTVASAAYPYHDPNPNTGDLVNKSLGSDKWVDHLERPKIAVAAKNTIHIGPSRLSTVSLPVVKMEDIPRNPSFGPRFPPLSSRESTIIV